MRLYNLLYLLLFVSSNSFASIVILNGLTHTHEIANGNVITGKIQVQNNGKKEAKILIYLEDLLVSCDKQVDYAKINSHNRSLGEWISMNVQEKIIQSNEVYEISYSISMPKDVKYSGSYWSAIMIEGVDPIKEDIEKGVKIDSKIRYALQIIANVGNIENSKISFENIGFTKKDSTIQQLNVKLKNNGAFVSNTKLSIEIYDNSGKQLKTIESSLRRIYPEKCNDFEILIKDLPKGTYNGVLIADNGKDLYGANVTLEIN